LLPSEHLRRGLQADSVSTYLARCCTSVLFGRRWPSDCTGFFGGPVE
jgi:hypothetical protein